MKLNELWVFYEADNFAYAVENALKIYGAHGEQNEWITSQQWLEAIKLTGYIESEIYMALAHKGAN